MFSSPSIFEKKDLNVIFNTNYEGSVEDFIKFRLGIEVDEEVLNKTLDCYKIREQKISEEYK